MDDNKIVEEIETPFLEETNLATDSNGCEQENVALPEAPVLVRNETDLNVIQNKRVELDGIQRDLDDLMGRLNTFIADSQEDSLNDDIPLDFLTLEEEEEVVNVTEKQDGPPEKELRLTTCASGGSLTNKIYITDGTNPPEINWDAVGPILQKHVTDLQKLHNLNQMTNAVVKRIKNVTQINDAILQKNLNKEEDS